MVQVFLHTVPPLSQPILEWSLLLGNRLDSLQKFFYKLLLRTGIPGSCFCDIFSFTKTAQRSKKSDLTAARTFNYYCTEKKPNPNKQTTPPNPNPPLLYVCPRIFTVARNGESSLYLSLQYF